MDFNGGPFFRGYQNRILGISHNLGLQLCDFPLVFLQEGLAGPSNHRMNGIREKAYITQTGAYMKIRRTFHTIDTHTGGEPTRNVVGGIPVSYTHLCGEYFCNR